MGLLRSRSSLEKHKDEVEEIKKDIRAGKSSKKVLKRLHRQAKKFEKIAGFVLTIKSLKVLKDKELLAHLRYLKKDSEVLRIRIGREVSKYLDELSPDEIESNLLKFAESAEVTSELSLIVRKLSLGGRESYAIFIGEEGVKIGASELIPIIAVADYAVDSVWGRLSMKVKQRLSRSPLHYREKTYADLNGETLPYIYEFLKGAEPKGGAYTPFLAALDVLSNPGKIDKVKKEWLKKDYGWKDWIEKHSKKEARHYYTSNAIRKVLEAQGFDLRGLPKVAKFYDKLAKITSILRDYEKNYKELSRKEKKKYYHGFEDLLYELLKEHFGIAFPRLYFRRISKFILQNREERESLPSYRARKERTAKISKLASAGGLTAGLIIGAPILVVLSTVFLLTAEVSEEHSRWLRKFIGRHS